MLLSRRGFKLASRMLTVQNAKFPVTHVALKLEHVRVTAAYRGALDFCHSRLATAVHVYSHGRIWRFIGPDGNNRAAHWTFDDLTCIRGRVGARMIRKSTMRKAKVHATKVASERKKVSLVT